MEEDKRFAFSFIKSVDKISRWTCTVLSTVLGTAGRVEAALTPEPTAWWRRCCEEGGRRRGALAREAVKCESGAPSPRSTPSSSSPKATLVFPIPLLFPTSLTRRFRLDMIEWPPVAFLSPPPLPVPVNEDDVDTEDDDVDRPFLVPSMTGKWSDGVQSCNRALYSHRW